MTCYVLTHSSFAGKTTMPLEAIKCCNMAQKSIKEPLAKASGTVWRLVFPWPWCQFAAEDLQIDIQGQTNAPEHISNLACQCLEIDGPFANPIQPCDHEDCTTRFGFFRGQRAGASFRVYHTLNTHERIEHLCWYLAAI